MSRWSMPSGPPSGRRHLHRKTQGTQGCPRDGGILINCSLFNTYTLGELESATGALRKAVSLQEVSVYHPTPPNWSLDIEVSASIKGVRLRTPSLRSPVPGVNE